MKKSSKGIINSILSFVFLFALPIIIVAIMFIALSKSFAIGLTVIISLLVVELLLGRKYRESFYWSEYRNFRFWGMTGEAKFNKYLNILFNATKVITVLGLLCLICQNFSEILNPFGGLGKTILVCSTLIGILIVCSGGYNKRGNYFESYEKVRASFALAILLTIVSFVYMTFGTQLIWIPLLATIMLTLFEGYEELGERFNQEEYAFGVYSAGAAFSAAIISTIIQFWSHIAYFFVTIWNFIVKVGTYEIISGGQVWVAVLIISMFVTLISVSRSRGRKDRAKREALKLQNEKEADAKRERGIKENEKIAAKEAEEAFKEKTIKMVEALVDSTKDRDAKIDEIVMLSKAVYKFGYSYLNRFSVKSLAGIVLSNFFTISEIKKRIVWGADFEYVLCMYADLYQRNYEDADLDKIISLFNCLVSYLSSSKEFSGYTKIVEKIQETKIPVNWEK